MSPDLIAASLGRRLRDWLAALVLLAGVDGSQAAAAETTAVPLRLATNVLHDLTLKELGAGAYEIHTTGSDPYLMTSSLPQPLNALRLKVLSFEYVCKGGIDHLQVFALPPGDEDHSIKSYGLTGGEAWATHTLDLRPMLEKVRGKLRALRLDFGSRPGKIIQIRSLQLRAPTEREQESQARRESHQRQEKALETHLQEYLRTAWPCAVTQIKVEDRQIAIDGDIGNRHEEACLVEVPMFANVTELKQFPLVEPIVADARGHFTVTLGRFQKRGDGEHDCLLSRWAVARKTTNGLELLSPARYADVVQPKWDLPEEKPRTKKGLGGMWMGRPLQDLDEMRISAATVNVSLNGLMRDVGPTSGLPAGCSAFSFAGKTWYSDDRAVGHLDQTLLEAARRQMIVSAIILVSPARGSPARSWGRLVAHPDADPAGIYVMPNVADEDGLEAYAAALDFLAQRYSRPDKKYGRIHHWIMHNEIDAGWEWTNAGEKTALLYLDLYQKSMRAMHLIARQYNAHAKVFISLAHFWAEKANEHFYPSKELLEWLLSFSKTEGDFDWAIAQHPYPEDLRNPRVWADKSVDFSFDTPKITFKNIEVLDAWVKQPKTFYLGRHRRTVHLTEQGLNSPDYNEKSLREQAAGMAYAWNKIKHLATIESFDYHNWVDNRAEGGLRIGLRKFPDEKGDPLGKKPIWLVYQALGSEREEQATAFAKPVIGISDWKEILFEGTIK